jgi:hypothetical protein
MTPLYRGCLALAHLALADDGLSEPGHEQGCVALALHIESEIRRWVAARLGGRPLF